MNKKVKRLKLKSGVKLTIILVLLLLIPIKLMSVMNSNECNDYFGRKCTSEEISKYSAWVDGLTNVKPNK